MRLDMSVWKPLMVCTSLVSLLGCHSTAEHESTFRLDPNWNSTVKSVRVEVTVAATSDPESVADTGAAVNEFLAPVWLHWVVQRTRVGIPAAVRALDFAETSRFFNDRLSDKFPEDGFGGLEASAARRWLASRDRNAVALKVENLVFETSDGRAFDTGKATTAERVAFLKEIANFGGGYPGSAPGTRR